MNYKIGRMVLGPVGTNCYFVYDAEDAEKRVIVVDPADQGETIYEKLNGQGFRVAGILLTHAHFDHIWGVNQLQELTKAKVYACEAERPLCESAQLNVSEQAGRSCTIKPDVYCRDGEEITIAGITCKLLATPGHTIGSCCYYFEEAGYLLSGDTLFQESVGRTDLPTGSAGALGRSVKEKLLPLPDETKVYPGHGDSTTIGYERKYNPFCC